MYEHYITIEIPNEEQKEDLENEFVVSVNNLISVLDRLAGDIHEIAKERRA